MRAVYKVFIRIKECLNIIILIRKKMLDGHPLCHLTPREIEEKKKNK